ncbi:IS200/IS605 family transposase, partial [Klebsiella pneumoniae]|uniref:IS200/IS605 family transposase n=1 Tax=Klebsiella pneumoniae TaxID=573 RepID=UPI002169F6E1
AGISLPEGIPAAADIVNLRYKSCSEMEGQDHLASLLWFCLKLFVHMLVEYPPTVQLSKLVNSLKAVTSRRLRNEFLDLREAYSKPVLWSRSYFVGSCGGAPLEVVKRYIQHQRG